MIEPKSELLSGLTQSEEKSLELSEIRALAVQEVTRSDVE